jgi:hypothetical protein
MSSSELMNISTNNTAPHLIKKVKEECDAIPRMRECH